MLYKTKYSKYISVGKLMSELKKKIEYKTYFYNILQKLLTRKYLVCNINNKKTY